MWNMAMGENQTLAQHPKITLWKFQKALFIGFWDILLTDR